MLLKDFVPPVFDKADEVTQMIVESLADNFIFSSLSDREIAMFVAALEPVSYGQDKYVITQGDEGQYFYVVYSGQVDFVIDDNKVGSCKAGGSFGDLALLYNCKRAASCVTRSECKLFRVDQVTFRHMLAGSQKHDEDSVIDILKKVPIFSGMDDTTFSKIADAMTEVIMHAGDQVITKGDMGNAFYLIKHGEVKVSDTGTGESQYVDHFLKEKDFFGERSLLTGELRAATVTVSSKTATLYALSKEDFDSTLGSLADVTNKLIIKRILTSVPVFADSELETFEVDQLLRATTIVSFEPGEVVQAQNEASRNALYMIMKGSVTFSHSNGSIGVLKSGDYFGAETLEQTATPEQSAKTPPSPYASTKSEIQITAESNGASCAELTKSSVIDAVHDLTRLGKPIPAVHAKLDTSIKFEHLTKHRILGMGTFGRVWLVTSTKTTRPYALKTLEKQQILKHDQCKGVVREKNIMASLNHPLIVNMVNSYKDNDHLYMLIELVLGGELFSILHTAKSDGVSVENSIFYSACILTGLIHMHDRKICYRDLKPENVLIDAEGYCIIVDLGFAKIVPNKTYTLCGTPEYLAPEIILSKGHDKAVDIWAMGVIIYEMIYGHSPFYSRGIDQVSLFKRIVQGKYDFTGRRGSPDASDLISKLLVRKPINRIGCNATPETDIFDHPFYNGVTIGKITRKEFVAPWTPKIGNPTDSSNFDSYESEENEQRNLSPLSAAEDALFADF